MKGVAYLMLESNPSPAMYQAHHPWHWITYGQNATAVGVFAAAILNLATIYVLVRTLRAVNAQARAADRQAKAAEDQSEVARKQIEVAEQQRVASERAATAAEGQVAAARAASASSEAQRIATEQSAAAEKEHSELIRQQLLASMRPVLVIAFRPIQNGSNRYHVENHGSGVALDIKGRYLGMGFAPFVVGLSILGPAQNALLMMDVNTFETEGCEIRYRSQDGRHFITKAKRPNSMSLVQETHEVNKDWEIIET